MVPTITDLGPEVRAFLDEARVATLATVTPGGLPIQAVIWFRLDPDGTVLINSRQPRRWPTALVASRRASLAVIDERDGMRWVGMDCRVASVDDDLERGRADIVALAHRYHDTDTETIATFMSQRRISFRLTIEGLHDHLGDE